MGKQTVEAQLKQLLENLQEWNQSTADLPEILWVNRQLLAQIKFSSDKLTVNEQRQLAQVVEQYQQIVSLVAQQKRVMLAKIRQLDRQKNVKRLPYQQQITDGGMIQLNY